MKNVNKAFVGKVLGALLMMCLLIVSNKGSGQIAGWDMNPLPGGNGNYGPSPYAATLTSSYVTIGGLTRGSGVGTTGIAAIGGWGGIGWNVGNQALAISNNKYVTFVININSAYPTSLSSINPFDYRRSSTGPTTGAIQYSLDGFNFTTITTVSYSSTSSSGASLGPIDLSGIGALQNLIAPTTVTFRIVNWGAGGSSGTWYIFDKEVSTLSDFTINGTSQVYFRSVQTGNWSDITTWETSTTGLAPWSPATIPPSSGVYSIEIQNGHEVTLPASQSIGGLLTTSGTGSLTGSSTTSLTISGTATNIRFTSGGSNNYLKDLTVTTTGNLTLANPLNITGGSAYGTVIASGVLNANGFMTLKSNATGTARVGYSTGTINGDVTVERYIPSKRTWRLLGPPLKTSSQSLKDAWQEGNTNSTLICANNGGTPGYGMHLTWNGLNGYDLNTTQNQSINYWNGSVWTPPASTTGVNILDHQGYMTFVRGDRTICLSQGVAAGSSATVLRTTGTLNVGTVIKTFTGLTPGQFIIVSNPFASPFNAGFAISSASGIQNVIYVWDPGSIGTYGYGAWVSVNGSGTVTPTGGTTNYPDAASIRRLQSGQAFVVQVTGTTASITFFESNKTTVQSLSAFARPSSTVGINLSSLSETGSAVVDGVAIQFDSSEGNSASKFFNLYENIYLKKGGKNFAIESRKLSAISDTFFLEMRGIYLKNYHLDISKNLVDKDVTVRFIDKFIGVDSPVRDLLSYKFTVTSDTASYKNRFMLIVKGKVEKIPFKEQDALMIYPNPTKGPLWITLEGKSYSGPVIITDLAGRTLPQRFCVNGTLNCSFLSPGLYMFRIGSQTTKVSKL